MAREKTREWAGRIRFHHGAFQDLAEAAGASGFREGRRAAGGPGRQPVSANGPGERFFIFGGWAAGYAHGSNLGTTAADLVNYTAEKALADLIFQLGEERRARRIARAIVRARPIRSTLHLADVVERAVPRTGRLHPATQTFMALRMAVNDEPGELDRLLRFGPEIVEQPAAEWW